MDKAKDQITELKDKLEDAFDTASRIRKEREELRAKKEEAKEDLEHIRDINRKLNTKCDDLEDGNRKLKYEIVRLERNIEDLKQEVQKAQGAAGSRDANHGECQRKEAELKKIIEEQNEAIMKIKRTYELYKNEQDANMSKLWNTGKQEDMHQDQGMEHKKQKTYDSNQQATGWENYQPAKYSSAGWRHDDQKKYDSYGGDDAQSNNSWKQQEGRGSPDPELAPYKAPLEDAAAGWVQWAQKAESYNKMREDKLLDCMANYWTTEQDGSSIVGEDIIMDKEGWKAFKERHNFEARVPTDGKDSFITVKHILAMQAIAAGAHKETKKEDRLEWWMPFGHMWRTFRNGYPDLHRDTQYKFKLVGLMAQARQRGANRTLKGPMFQVMMIPCTEGFERTEYYAYIRLNGPHSKENPCMVYANGESKWADLLKLGLEGK